MRSRLHLIPVDIQHIAHRLESEERYAHRQHNIQKRQRTSDPEFCTKLIGLHYEEAVILEEAEHSEIEYQRQNYVEPVQAVAVGAPHKNGENMIHHG